MRKHKVKKTRKEYVVFLCQNKKCEFFGKPTVQGVCHREDPDVIDYKKLDKQEKEARETIKWLKKKFPGKKYVKALESYYECAWINWSSSLDETIYLRMQNARMRLKRRTAHKR
jgi:hypothetical protein